ncbi:MAG: hypothetical protein KIT25_06505 [Enhydrobacter sp.]|nr:MAG: hypothetical protein KIT25_06505 [Enhydrobacter sp.]
MLDVRRIGLVAALLLAPPMGAAAAADFAVEDRELPGPVAKVALRSATIRMTGVIGAADSSKLRTILVRLTQRTREADALLPMATAELSSIGGDVVEGMRIGALLREFAVATVVKRGDQCLSACALAFLGGSEPDGEGGRRTSRALEPGADLAFHNIGLNAQALSSRTPEGAVVESFNVARLGAAAIVQYAADMGVPAGFVARLLAQPSDQLLHVATAGDLADLEICPAEAIAPALPVERQAVNVCNNGMNWDRAPAAGQVRSVAANEAMLRLLTHVYRNLETLPSAQRYAAQLKAVIESRDRRLIASTYDALRGSGAPLPVLESSTFVVGGYSAGYYRMECVVSLSNGRLGTFDMVIAGPKGFASPVRRGPAACPWLLLYDRRDVVSPPRS